MKADENIHDEFGGLWRKEINGTIIICKICMTYYTYIQYIYTVYMYICKVIYAYI